MKAESHTSAIRNLQGQHLENKRPHQQSTVCVCVVYIVWCIYTHADVYGIASVDDRYWCLASFVTLYLLFFDITSMN